MGGEETKAINRIVVGAVAHSIKLTHPNTGNMLHWGFKSKQCVDGPSSKGRSQEFQGTWGVGGHATSSETMLLSHNPKVH